MNLNNYYKENFNSTNQVLFHTLFFSFFIPMILIVPVSLVNQDIAGKYIYTNLDLIILIRNIVIFLIISSILLPLLIFCVSKITGENQKLVLNFYNPFTKFIIHYAPLTAFISGVILLYAAAVSVDFLLTKVEFKDLFRGGYRHITIMIAALLIGVIGPVFYFINIIFNFYRSKELKIYGKLVSEQEQPELFKIIKTISNEVNSIFPDNIIIGNQIGFFVTAANVLISNENKKVSGNTLYISLPFFKILTEDEFKGIIGHELAHFSGEDTIYASKVGPTIVRLAQHLNYLDAVYTKNLESKKSSADKIEILRSISENSMLMIPSLPLMYLIIDLRKKDVAISYKQELRADKIGASVCKSNKNFINGLCKFALYQSMYEENDFFDYDQNQSLINKFTNKYLDQNSYINKKRLEEIMLVELLHPSDSHPSIKERMKNLKVKTSDLNTQSLKKTTPSSSNFIKDIDELDGYITRGVSLN